MAEGNENINVEASASLYTKLLDIGLNDKMIGEAITQINDKEPQNPDVLKEGYLGKESVHLKKLRQRWMVLKGKYLYSYREKQVYENPTEIFDLKLYRTAKMVNGTITGEFELISLSQDKRRILIASNKEEMNEWIKYIKKVILFSNEYSDKCRSIRSCLSLRRLRDVIRLYSLNDSALRYITSYKQLIDDYHHVLQSHLNGGDNINKSYELIEKTINIECDINECSCYIRNNRIRSNEEKSDNDHEYIVYRDLLDTIHCSLIHAFDSGFYIKHKDLQHIMHNDKEEEEEDPYCFDRKLMKLKNYLCFYKKRFQKLRKDRNHRFYCNTKHSQALPPLMLNEERKNETDLISSEFGRKYVYWDHCKSSPFYVYRKYDNLKLEIMDNILHPLSISKYISTHIKSYLLSTESSLIRSKHCDGHNPYGIQKGSLLSIEHIMAVIFYTDFDILSSHFVSTFMNGENHVELMLKHREFCVWSKLLNEVVQCYGATVNNSNICSYFVCTPLQYFDSFHLRFNCPTSMTTSLCICSLICPQSGIVLEIKKRNCYIGEWLRYFDCSAISSFSFESEKLFIGGSQCLKLNGIRSMNTNKCYKQFIEPFCAFIKIMNGKDILQILWNLDYLIISNLISSKIINKKAKYPSYIIQCFDKFCLKQKIIKINIKSLYNFNQNFIHLNHKNLLLFDNLAILFRNAHQIYSQKTGIINDIYFKELFIILRHIKQKKLNKIVLNGITEIKISDKEFQTYKNLFNQKVQWVLDKKSDNTSTLILTKKCVLSIYS